MIRQVLKNNETQFTWIDIVDPSPNEFKELATTYQLHPSLVQACLDPENLPKMTRARQAIFIILRGYDDAALPDADTVQELTRKIAIFYLPNALITIHRKDQHYIETVRNRWVRKNTQTSVSGIQILTDLLRSCVDTFRTPIERDIAKLEDLESRTFVSSNVPTTLEDGYYLKRKAAIYRRMLQLTMDILPRLSRLDRTQHPYLQGVKDSAQRLYFYASDLLENIYHLLDLHISLESHRLNEASHRTNEIMRILTLFSVFFLPLNFVASIYGMNFEHMPELKMKYAYPAALTAMICIGISIFTWFRKKGWLK